MRLVLSILSLTFVLFTGCSSDSPVSPQINEDTAELRIISSAGNEVDLNGTWKTNCEVIGGVNMKETLEFNDNSLKITIYVYNEGNCDGNPVETQIIDINFESKGEITAVINGQTVKANKISGTSTNLSTGRTENFKQTFFILEENNMLKFYHGVFEDDGGRVSGEGYPLDLHNFPFFKQ